MLPLFAIFTLAVFSGGCTHDNVKNMIIPRPVSVQMPMSAQNGKDFFNIDDTADVMDIAMLELSDDEDLPSSDEGYALSVRSDEIVIRSRGEAGLFYGLQTLSQLTDFYGKRIPVQEIVDAPRFAWRGLHLDVSRHFFDKDFILKQLRMMALLKLNRLHLHLTDGAGWRIAIDHYPQLTGTAAWRIGKTWKEWQEGGCRYAHENEPGVYGGYFTKDDIREMVAYADSLHITIVPEIEMPSHSEEVISLFPNLSCTGKPDTGDFCIGNEATFEFLENVLSEVIELFPSEYIHIGGDEASKSNWADCAKCQALMKREGLAGVDELQGYAVRRIEKFLNAHGRRLIGWDEILDGNPTPESVLMSWRGEEGGRKAASAGHDVIMTPGAYCYFDGYQDNPTTEPQAFSGYLPLKKVYGYDPAPSDMEGAERVMGVQANLWTEYIPTPEQAEYMLYPRAFALAEVAWSPVDAIGESGEERGKNYEDFHRRALQLCTSARKKGYNTFDLALETGERPESLRPEKHLAAGCPVSFATQWNKNYPANGDATLTDGIRGSWSYGNRWLGFVSKDMDATVDLGGAIPIREVKADFIQWYSAWIWLPAKVEISVSDDGENFRSLCVLENDYPEEEHRPEYRTFGWQGNEQARYVRYHAFSNGRPGGWLFTDEIIIN